jgi:tRNA(Arg) A34 adenosine deaminase TadA
MSVPFQPKPEFMRLAIGRARSHLELLEGGPFAACIVRADEVLAVAHNTVLKDRDPTCHAEINAIRSAAQRLSTHDLSGCHVYSTTEPCPMCFAALHWARAERVIYGTTIQDVKRLGFHELEVSNEQLKRLGGSPLLLHKHFLRQECCELLDRWHRLPGRQTY